MVDSNHQKYTAADYELKRSVLTLIDYFKELFRKWYVYVLCFLLLGIPAFLYYGTLEKSYTAKLTFMTNDESGGGYSPLTQLAGQFGFNTDKSGVSSDKIVELIRTRKIILSTLVKKDIIDDKNDLLINHFYRLYNMNEVYLENPELQDFVFESKSTRNYTWKENKISQDIYKKIIGDYLVAASSENGIISVNFNSESESFSKVFLDHLYDTLSSFYVSKTNQKQRETFDIVKEYTDSLNYSLRSAESELAQWKDKNVLKVKNKGIIEELRLLRKVETLNTAYTEALKNLELSKFNLISQTPILQLIDKPVFPLKVNNPNLLYLIVITFAVAWILATLIIIVLKIIRDALKVN